MQSICGVIRNTYEDGRVFEVRVRNRLMRFYLTKSQVKKFGLFIQNGIYVFLKCYDEPRPHEGFLAYDVISFLKIVRHVAKKTITYYDVSTIKDGVKKLLKKDSYRMFIDLEFTMPPYNYVHDGKNEFYSEIVQYGIYIEDANGNAVDGVKGLIKPKCSMGVSDRTLDFLHLSKSEVMNAPYYSKFYNKFKNMLTTYQPNIYVWGKNDYLMIEKSFKDHNCEPLTERKNYINLMQVIKNYYNIKEDIGLYNAFFLFGSNPPMEIQDHDAYNDTMATVLIFHLFEKELEE